ncbi:MAG: hypothetical protein CME71_03640 [Halobacteriovorax sp.]|nr:hypothetical protein [Halobacteriovorax sp.]
MNSPNIQKLLSKIDQFKNQVPTDLQVFFDSTLWLKRIKRETGVDLRDLQLRRDRASSHEALFEGIRPVGTIGHIMPGNSEWTPLLAILETAITGNKSWVKLPSGSDKSILEAQLAQLGLEDSVKVYTERGEIESLYKTADAISAWGSESSLEDIRKKISSQTRFIPWGHRISFAYLNTWENEAADLAQAMVKYEQQACSSPQICYLENASFDQAKQFAKDLALELDKHSSSFPALDDSTWAELSNFTQTHLAESCLKEKFVIEAADQSYRIVVDTDATFEASVLNRTIFIKTIEKGAIANVLAPHRRLLQSVGISKDYSSLESLCESLIEAGVSRVCPVASMQDAHPLEAHDGEFSLSRFTRRVSVHAPGLEVNVLPQPFDNETPKTKITDKSDFQKSVSPDADFYFKSGGSSAKPILSPFTYADYHLQMQVAADGLIAAGLDPKSDKCMNVFFGGGLYGGFLSFTDILEKTGCSQYPMSGYLDLDFVLDTIISQNINVLLGMPSYMTTLYKRAVERNLKLPIQKIFFGGEPFSLDQRSWLKELGVNAIFSASYGSVDAGPLGYQCTHSKPGEHHVNTSIQKIEIVKLSEDAPCDSNEVGRVLVSSLARTGVAISRYQIGDTASWVEGKCPCGDSSPKLLLQGRIGDIFKFGGSFFNAQKIKNQIGDSELQLVIKKTDLLDELIINTQLSEELTKEKIMAMDDFKEIVELEKSALFRVINTEKITAVSGKSPLLIDQRQ